MLFQLPVITQDLSKPIIAIVQKVEAPKPVEYVIKENDNLTKIATAQNTNIERLWEKNTQLENPDIVKAGDTIIIPNAEEVLSDRPLPAIVEPIAVSQTSAPSTASGRSSVSAPRGASAGNTYSPGYCTWYAKSQRPDMPNNLGNADTWYARAAAQGMAVGGAPAMGAVAAAVGYMHVAIVTGINDDGTIQVTEMNYKGRGVVSSRTAPASEFRYIY